MSCDDFKCLGFLEHIRYSPESAAALERFFFPLVSKPNLFGIRSYVQTCINVYDSVNSKEMKNSSRYGE